MQTATVSRYAVRGRRAPTTATPRTAIGEAIVHQTSTVMLVAASHVGQPAVSASGMAGAYPGRATGTRRSRG